MAQSFGGFTAPLVADRLRADVLVLVAGMIPFPGEAPQGWWYNTGYSEAVREQAARDGGLTGNADRTSASTTTYRASWPRRR